MNHHALNVVIREALARRSVTTLRGAEEALRDPNTNQVTLTKDAIGRRYRDETPWTYPDLERVAAFLGIETSELVARAEQVAA